MSTPLWVHCNICMSSSFRKLFMTSCGKTVCDKCKPRLAEISCSKCKGPCTRTVEINDKAPEEVRSLFSDPVIKLKSVFKCIGFQDSQKRAILENERREVALLEAELNKVMAEDEEEERLYNEMVKEYEEVSKQEAILDAEIEQLRREVGDDDGPNIGGALGGIVSPLEFPDRSSSSSGSRSRRRAKPSDVSPSSNTTPLPSSEKPFLQMKTPAAWYEHQMPKRQRMEESPKDESKEKAQIMDKSGDNLKDLHSSLSDEVNKLVRWEAETAAVSKDQDSQLQQVEQTIASQQDLLLKLQKENVRLRGFKKAALDDRKELEMKIGFSERELQVLCGQFQEVEAMFQALKLDDYSLPQPSRSDKYVELISSVSKMRNEAVQTFLQKKEELNQSSRNVSNLKVSGDQELQQLDLEIANLKEKIDVESLQKMKVEEQLSQAEEVFSSLQTQEGTLKLKIQSQTEELETLDQKSKEINDLYVGKIEEKRLNIEKLIKRNKDLEERKLKLKCNFEEKKAALIEANKVKTMTVEELENCQKEMTLKEKNISDLKAKLSSQVKEIDELKVKTACESNLQRELDFLKEEVKASNDKKQSLEKELSNYSKVFQQKAASDEEKINLISRLQLLREKDESYAEDLVNCNQRLKESELKITEVDLKIRKVEDENKNLTENVEQRKISLENIRKNCTDLEEEEMSLRKNLEEMRKNHEMRESRIEKLSFEKEMLEKSLKDVDEKLSIVGNEMESTQDEVLILENELEAADNKIADLQIQLSGVEDEHVSINSNLEKLSNEVKEKEALDYDLIKKISVAKGDVTTLDESICSLKEKISAKTDGLNDLDKRKKELSLTVEKLKIEKSSKEELIKSKAVSDPHSNEEKIFSLEEELKRNQSEVERLRTDELEIEKKIENINDTIQSQKSSLEKLQSENKNAEEENENLNLKLKDLQVKVNQAKDNELKKVNVTEEVKEKVSSLNKDIKDLENLKSTETSKFRAMLEEKSRKFAEVCKPHEEDRKAILQRIAEIEGEMKKVDVKIKTKTAQKRKDKLVKLKKVKESDKNSLNTLKGLQNKCGDVQAQIEAQNKRNSNLQKLVDVSNASALKIDDSDDEDINPRRTNVGSGKTKRKLVDNLDIDVFDFETERCPQNFVPSTPLNTKKLLTRAQSEAKFPRKSALASLIDNKGGKTKNNKKEPKAKLSKENKVDKNFDEIMQISSVSP